MDHLTTFTEKLLHYHSKWMINMQFDVHLASVKHGIQHTQEVHSDAEMIESIERLTAPNDNCGVQVNLGQVSASVEILLGVLHSTFKSVKEYVK